MLSFALAFLFTGMAACNQEPPPAGDLQGTITLETGGPASSVPVELSSLGVRTATDAEGTFSIQDLKPGTFECVVRLDGYVTLRSPVEIVDGETTKVYMTLEQVNAEPFIESIDFDPKVSPAEETSVSVSASDPNPDELGYSFDTKGGFEVESSDGSSATIVAPDTFGTRGRLTVEVSDPDGATARQRVSISTKTNTPPIVEGLNAAPQTLQPEGTATITALANDPDSDELSYQWSAPEGWSIDDPTEPIIEVTAPDRYGATGIFELTVTDSRGLQTSARLPLATMTNEGPVISSIEAPALTVGREETLQLNVSASDPNDDPLSFSWSAPSGWTFDDPRASSPTLTAPNSPGEMATLEVSVADGNGGRTTGSMVISTRRNTAPVIQSLVTSSARLNPQGSTEVSVDATDPEGDDLTYNWTASSNDWSINGTGKTITLKAPDSHQVSTDVTVQVTDDSGESASSSLSVRTGENDPPIVDMLYAMADPVPRGGTTNVTAQGSDPNGDYLYYNWSVDDPDWSIQQSAKKTITLEAPDTPNDSALVTVTLEDTELTTTSATTQVSTAANKAPKITSIPNVPTSVVAGRGPTVSYQPTVSDPDDSSWNWNVTTVPDTSASFDSSGQLTWHPSHADAGSTVTLTVSATDGNASAAQTFAVPVTDVSFSPTGSYEVGTNPTIAPLDLDKDGLMDFAGSIDAEDDISWVLSGEGYTIETTEEWYQSDPDPFGRCLIDKASPDPSSLPADMLSACAEDGTGSTNLTIVEWSASSGSFFGDNVVNTGIPSEPTDMTVIELDDGSRLSEFVVSDASNTMHVFERDANRAPKYNHSINPSKPSNYASDGSYAVERMRTGDVDSDPQKELVALESFNNASGTEVTRASVFSFDGTETLLSARDTTVVLDDDPDKMALGDVDGDGVDDIVVKTSGNSGPVAVETYTSDGTGTFSADASISSPTLCNDPANRGIAVGDIDLDGHTDIVVGDGCDSSLHVAFGTGSGSFTSLHQTDQAPYGSTSPENVYIRHTNNGAYPDLIAYESGRLSIFR